MHYVIDAYNLIGQMESISLSDNRKEQKLIAFLQQHASDLMLKVVFDGKQDYNFARKERVGCFSIIYTGSDQSADAYIIENMQKKTKEICIVSCDREILDEAKRHRIHHITCQSFLKRILTQEEWTDTKQVNIGSIDEWMDTFGEDKNT